MSDATVTPDHLWRHFTPLASPGPMQIARAEGCWLWNRSGRRYLDCLAGLVCVNAGHSRPEIAQAVFEQMRELAYISNWNTSHPKAVEAARRVSELAPEGFERVMFLNSGAEAVEAAIKLARQRWLILDRPEKTKIITREGAYHGTTLGALAATQISPIQDPFKPLAGGFLEAPAADDPAALEGVRELIEAHSPDAIAAIVIEPIQNGGGCRIPAPGYNEELAELCREAEITLISDEVICSFGRTGSYFGSSLAGYRPDIIATAKGLTSGHIPMSAILVSREISAPFENSSEVFLHGSTFGGHPAAAAAAVANLEIFEREGLCERASRYEAELRDQLLGLQDLPLVREVRGQGYFWAVELDLEEITDSQRASLLRETLTPALYEAGVVARAEDSDQPILKLSPPLIAGPREFELAARAFERAIKKTAEAAARSDVG